MRTIAPPFGCIGCDARNDRSKSAQRGARTPPNAARSRQARLPETPSPQASVDALELRLLGPLELRRAGEPLPLGGRQQRALLALLALELSAPVPLDRLVDSLWGERPPASAAHAIQVYVSKLRKLLGPETLLRRAGGYALTLPREQLDATRFERLLAEGEEALPHDPARAAVLLAEALALWRGAALSDFTYEPFAQAEIARFEELRLRAEETCLAAELALGRGPALLGELEALVARAPLRERPRALLMHALYQAGRQAEALAAYREARKTLREELGLEPGPDLKALERAILAQDEALAAPARAPAPAREVRKTVSVLFCDLVDSSRLASQLDPEALRHVLDRYFETVSGVIARHGGTVEKFIGDAVVAVFGSPVAHEDDPLRAARAAIEITLAAASLESDIAVRVGIESGEVVAGEPIGGSTGVTGGVTTAAARLQEEAPVGSVAVGDGARRLLAHAARFEPLTVGSDDDDQPRSWRLVEVLPGAPAVARRLDAPLVGREAELAVLADALARAAETRSPTVVAVLGEPGIGKTRLARELASRVGDARVLVGRVRPYGEAATFAPLADLLDAAANASGSVEAIGDLLTDDTEAHAVARRIAAALGQTEETFQREEVFWAVRRLVESLARDRPLVIVLDDVHWAEATLLQLVEHVATTAEAPVLLVCLARPELRDEHPRWGEGGETIALEPLSAHESEAVIDELAAALPITSDDRAWIAATGEGNPLFLEQLVAFAAERPGATEVPPTLEALLASRLDRLGPGERLVIEAAAVVGREFTAPAVAALLPPEATPTLARHLEALGRKQLVTGDWTPRFRHALIRDAAYRSIPKTKRAELHERLGRWSQDARITTHGGDEAIGFHLERAYRYRSEIGPVDDKVRALGFEAAERLAHAGRRAYFGGDVIASEHLLRRAFDVTPPGAAERGTLLLHIAEAIAAADEPRRALDVLDAATSAARASGDRKLEWRVEVERHAALLELDEEGNVEAARRTAERAIEALEELGDYAGVARAWSLAAVISLVERQFPAMQTAAERARSYARRIGDKYVEAVSIVWEAIALKLGPTPLPEVIDALQASLPRLGELGDRAGEAYVQNHLAHCYAYTGRFAEARVLLEHAQETFRRLGAGERLRDLEWSSAEVDLAADDPIAAETKLRSACAGHRRTGRASALARASAELADALFQQGRLDEADEMTRESERAAPAQDAAAQIAWRAARAGVLVARGDVRAAEPLAREAVELSTRVDTWTRADVLVVLAKVLRDDGRLTEAVAAATEALRIYEAKGDIVSSREVNALLGGLEARSAAATG
jgi:DNA-binding SARP family transcriptional activator